MSATTRDERSRPRTKPAPQRRRELLDAGLEVFREKRVTAATVDEIARRAGVAKGTFYLHFETKEHLLAALQQDFETGLVDRLDRAARDRDDPVAALAAWVDAAFAHYPEDVAMHDVLFHHPVLPEPAPHTAAPGIQGTGHRDLVASLTEVIEHGCAADVFAVADIDVTALLLCSALHLMFDRVRHRDRELDTHRYSHATRTHFRRALGCDR